MPNLDNLYRQSTVRREGHAAFETLEQACLRALQAGPLPDPGTLYGRWTERGPENAAGIPILWPELPTSLGGQVIVGPRRLDWLHTEYQGDGSTQYGYSVAVMLRRDENEPPAAVLWRSNSTVSELEPGAEASVRPYELRLTGDSDDASAPFGREHLSPLLRRAYLMSETRPTCDVPTLRADASVLRLNEPEALIVVRAMALAFRDACRT